jgi:hypothetical protein
MQDNTKQLQRSFILIDLLIQEIDTVTEKPMPKTIVLRERLGAAQDVLIEMFDDVYAKSNIQRTSFFQTVQKKFNYNLEREEKKLFKK